MQIYTGPWIDHSRGWILGATITLTSRDGALLVAGLSVFLIVVGSQFWTIVRFIIHQLNAAKRPTDAVHCQHQVVFRNSNSSTGAALELIKLPFSWRRNPNRKLRSRPFWRILTRSWGWALVPIVNFAFWAAAGLLSSEVTTGAGGYTLIQPGNCGLAYDNDTDNPFGTKLVNDTRIAYPYARACYGSNSTSAQCNNFAQQQISWDTNMNASCPFQSGFCYFSDTAALELDTKYMDSHRDLGINAPEEDRVSYRRVAKCAVLDPEAVRNFTTENQNNITLYPTYQYYLGPFSPGSEFGSEFTFKYDSYLSHSDVGYSVMSLRYYTGSPSDQIWWPTTELIQADADLTLIWVSPNSIIATEPIDDPFFGFHTPYGSESYESDNYVNIMACTDQCQICNPGLQLANESPACTPLVGAFLLQDELSKIGLNAAQNATARLILSVHGGDGIGRSVHGRGNAALLAASEHVESMFQNHLPDDQWMIEVKNWFAISLSKLQHAVVEYATGPPFPSEHVGVKSLPEWQSICTSIKVTNSGGFLSFNVLGLAIIFSIGTVIIITSIILEPVVSYVHRNWATKYDYRRLHWVLDGKLQLQRMAYQHAGIGSWEKKNAYVPVTADEAKIFQMPREIRRKPPGFSRGFDAKVSLVETGQELGEQDGLMTVSQL